MAPIKPIDLPIYAPEPTKVLKEESAAQDPSMALEAVKTVRMGINEGFNQLVEVKEQVDHIVDTGKAHTQCT